MNHAGLLSNAEITGNFATADSVLAVYDQPHCGHPLVHSEGAIFEDGPYLYGELLLAALAEPNAASRYERVLFGLTARARDVAIGPAEIDREGEALLKIGKVGNRFLQCFWLGVVAHVQNSNSRFHVCQVNSCPNLDSLKIRSPPWGSRAT